MNHHFITPSPLFQPKVKPTNAAFRGLPNASRTRSLRPSLSDGPSVVIQWPGEQNFHSLIWLAVSWHSFMRRSEKSKTNQQNDGYYLPMGWRKSRGDWPSDAINCHLLGCDDPPIPIQNSGATWLSEQKEQRKRTWRLILYERLWSVSHSSIIPPNWAMTVFLLQLVSGTVIC